MFKGLLGFIFVLIILISSLSVYLLLSDFSFTDGNVTELQSQNEKYCKGDICYESQQAYQESISTPTPIPIQDKKTAIFDLINK